MTNINEQITEAFIACVSKACERWPILRSYKFTLDILEFQGSHARNAGLAYGYSNTIKINLTHARINLDDCLNDTVPHEVAHLVQKIIRPTAKQAHGPEWKAICRYLGGSGKRCYTDDQYPGLELKRKTRNRHTYNVNGEIMMLGPVHHNRIQNGARSYRSKRTGTTITRDMYVSSAAIQPVQH